MLSVFDRYDIASEEDLAEASRKLQALMGDNFRDNGGIGGPRPEKPYREIRDSGGLNGGEGQNRTVDTTIFSRWKTLFQPSSRLFT